jgi:Domain of unknown function (DUF4349)
MRQATPHPAPGRAAVPATAGLAAGLIITAVLLAGCGGTTSGASSSAPGTVHAGKLATGPPAASAAPGANAAAGSSARRPATAGAAGAPARLSAAGPDIVYTASMTVRVPEVSQGAAQAAQIAARAGGYVSQENLAPAPVRARAGAGAASIQLKIPVAAYPATLARLAGLGMQTSLRQQAQDVTQQVADTASRVASDRAAITALRALLARAGSVGALLAVQDQVNAQESDLEALQAQQRALDHATAYATVSLRLVGPVPAKHAVKHRRKRAGGFIGGLTDGWKALVTVVSWLARALGAILPIGAACGLAGYLGYRGLRWLQQRRRVRPAAPSQ